MTMVQFQGNKEDLSVWARNEYRDAIASRRAYELQLDEYDRQYEQIPKVSQKSFPWQDASNLEVGIGATHVDTILSRVEDAYFVTQPNVIVRSLTGKFKEHCQALQDYMNLISLPRSGYRQEKAIDLLQCVKLGTSFQYLTYETKFKQIRESNGKVRRITTHEGPLQQAIHPRNLIHPPEARDIENARFIAIRSFKTWGEIISLRDRGVYDPNIVAQLEGNGVVVNIGDTKREKRQGIRRTGRLKQWEIVSMKCLFQGDKDKYPEDVWLDFHYPSGQILYAIYNPYDHLKWPFSKSVYMFREDAFLGLGIMAMTSMIQEEITTIHNYCLDNLLAANTVMLLAKKGSVTNIDIQPMGMIEFNANKDDVRIERLGTALSGQQVGEAAANAYAERRTGASEASVNRQAPTSGLSSSRTPATTTMALLGEGNKRFALALENNKRADSDLLMQHALLLRQYWGRQRVIAELWDVTKTRLIEELFSLDIDSFRNNVLFEVAASTVALNKQTEQQNMLVIGQFMQQFYKMFIGYLTLMAQQPPLEPVIRKILNGASYFVERLLRTFDVRDPETYIPRIDEVRIAATNQPQGTVDKLTQTFLTGATSGVEG